MNKEITMNKIKIKVGIIELRTAMSSVGEIVELKVDGGVVCTLQGDGFKDLINAVTDFSAKAIEMVAKKEENNNKNNLKQDEKEGKIRLR